MRRLVAIALGAAAGALAFHLCAERLARLVKLDVESLMAEPDPPGLDDLLRRMDAEGEPERIAGIPVVRDSDVPPGTAYLYRPSDVVRIPLDVDEVFRRSIDNAPDDWPSA